MAYVQSAAKSRDLLPGIDPRVALNSLANAVLGLLDVWEEAIDPARWPEGWEVRYADHAPHS